jgi:hypothetical protein
LFQRQLHAFRAIDGQNGEIAFGLEDVVDDEFAGVVRIIDDENGFADTEIAPFFVGTRIVPFFAPAPPVRAQALYAESLLLP